MKILILEDNKERIEWFKKIYKQHELIICEKISQAQLAVAYGEIDIFFLDHDIASNNFEGIDKCDTGYDFVKWIVSQNYQKHSLYYIHSMNPTGANAMLNLLKDNGYEAQWVPYHLLKLEGQNG